MTGQVILDEGGNIEDVVMKKCPYYYLLEPIMADCPGTNPILVADIGVQGEDNKSESATVLEDDAVAALFVSPNNDNNPIATAAATVKLLTDSNGNHVNNNNVGTMAVSKSISNEQKRPLSLTS